MSGELDKPSPLRSGEPYVPDISGWPAAVEKAEQILKELHLWVEKGDDKAEVVFHAEFLPILDEFLSQLIAWAEQGEFPALREWAGWALAERFQFLSAQHRDWCNEKSFAKRRAQFGDRRHARAPRSYLGWLAGDYLRKLMNERVSASLFLMPPSAVNLNNVKLVKPDATTVAESLGYSKERILHLKRLSELPAFSSESAYEWGEFVFETMQPDEQKILGRPEMRRSQSRDSRQRRRNGKVRLYDFKRTIIGAVVRLASKPAGYIRGITRPVE